MTLPSPDNRAWRRIAVLEQRVNELESALQRLSSPRAITPLSGRLWRCELTSAFEEHKASADLYTLKGVDTERTISVFDALENATVSEGDKIYVIEQIDLAGERYYIPLTASGGWYIGKVKTAAIAAESSGTVEQCEYDWTGTGTDFTVYNPHGIELPLNWHVRWTKYPGWTACGDPATDWIVEPWHYTECPPDDEE